MKEGSIFLMDEISLADDSVLERLNSVLERERTLVLAEKGGGDVTDNEVDHIVAEESFRIVATMNPGGDYGKKEVYKYMIYIKQLYFFNVIYLNIITSIITGNYSDNCQWQIKKFKMCFLFHSFLQHCGTDLQKYGAHKVHKDLT